VLAGAATAASTAGFTPRSIAGTWRGTWTNETFNSTGPAFISVKAPQNKRLVFNADFGGNVFGCQDPPAEKGGITKGSGANHWNARGFVIKRRSNAFGTLKITYSHARRTLTGNGTNPTCNNGLRWSLSGRFEGKKFTGTVNITLPDGTPAVSRLNLSR
jgi:hypothetical protein